MPLLKGLQNRLNDRYWKDTRFVRRAVERDRKQGK